MEEIQKIRSLLLDRLTELDDKRSILRAPELRGLYEKIKNQPNDQKAEYGKKVNDLKQELVSLLNLSSEGSAADNRPIDVTAPFDVNSKMPSFLPVSSGSVHPISAEIEKICNLFYRMGFEASESPEIDDEYHMFTSLNFPEGHPARDDYDTFMTEDGYVAPAHTSTMQNRIIMDRKERLSQGEPIAVIAVDRVFRNEDLGARHEHTFNQVEGVYVSKDVTVGNLVATLKTFLENYFNKNINIKITPFYFPFTEPSFELSLSCPFCSKKSDCRVCSNERWIELIGCGMIHPSVLKEAGVDPEEYTGFAWGCGIERLIMMRHNIEDIRHFNSGKLSFLRQFK